MAGATSKAWPRDRRARECPSHEAVDAEYLHEKHEGRPTLPRDVGSVSVPRLVVTFLCCALVPVAVSIPSLATLAILAALMCALAAFETVRSREFRRELRTQ